MIFCWCKIHLVLGPSACEIFSFGTIDNLQLNLEVEYEYDY